MYLSDRELEHAITCGRLIVTPPTEIGPTSIDLHLGSVDQAKVWDLAKFEEHNVEHGLPSLELVVHLTAPTIHAGWSGKITLEISNLGQTWGHFTLSSRPATQWLKLSYRPFPARLR